MNLKFRFLLLGILAGIIALTSCKKNDSEVETLPSMEGQLSFKLPMFAKVGDEFNLTGNEVVAPNTGVSYYWTSTSLLQDTIKGREASIVMPDSLATFTVKFLAKCSGYYEKSVSSSVTTIIPGRGHSLTGMLAPLDSIKDLRDNQWYGITKVGNLYWFSQNLNWAGSGQAYGRADAAGYVFGRLYSWNDATLGKSGTGLGNGPQGVCPAGWHIPTNQDWEDLAKVLNNGVELPFTDEWNGLGEKLMVDASFNGTKFWPFSPNVTPLNTVRWDALSTGYSLNNYDNYASLFSYGFWWTATEKDSDSANYRYIFYNRPSCPINYADKSSFGASVRCVKLIK